MTKENTIQLSASQLRDMGDQLTSLMNRLKMTSLAIEGLQMVQKQDQAAFNWLAIKFFDTTFDQNLDIRTQLEEIASQLIECTNAQGLAILNGNKE